MADTKSKVTLKLLVDKAGKRVLFAETGKDFIDFLFSLMVLPIGTVIRLLDNPDMLSGLTKLYKSVNDLNDGYLQSNLNKDDLLKPKSSLPLFTTNVMLPSHIFSSPALPQTTFNRCEKCKIDIVITGSYTNLCCQYCGSYMKNIKDRYVSKALADAKGGGFANGVATYIVMDDLAVSPISTLSKINLLDKLNIKDLGSLEEKVVHIGMDEGLKLLKHSLSSKTVLTDLFLGDVVGIDAKPKRPKSEGN